MAFVNAFRQHEQTMPLQYLSAFLLVAGEEGLSVSEYARRAHVSISVMSRHLLDIGDRTRLGEEGLGLVTFRVRPENMREHEYLLTPKGKILWQQIVQLME
jgi:DNA-binding MarR family transcriptional regulator